MLFVFCSNCEYSYSRGLNSWQGCLESLKLLVKVCKDHSSDSVCYTAKNQLQRYKLQAGGWLSSFSCHFTNNFFFKPLRKANPTSMSRWLEERKLHNFSPNRIGTIQKFDRYIYYLLSLSLSAKLTKFNQNRRILNSRPFTTRTTCSMTRPISCHRRPRIDNPSSAVGISCSYQ